MTDFSDLPLFAAGDALKTRNLDKVLSNAGAHWIDQASELIQDRLGGQEVLAECFRMICEEEGVKPHHHNAWGGLTSALVKRGILEETGRIEKSKDPRSHSRRQPVWRVKSSTKVTF
jgi:hypothetical protein